MRNIPQRVRGLGEPNFRRSLLRIGNPQISPTRHSFKAGDSPETIRQNFPSLTLEQVYGAIAFYLAHEQEVDAISAKEKKT